MPEPTKIGIVYSNTSKMVQRIVIPDSDVDLDKVLVGDMQTLLQAPIVPQPSLEYCEDQVFKATGQMPRRMRCFQIDEFTNTVTGLVMGDKTLLLTEPTYVHADDAVAAVVQAGDSYDPQLKTFTTKQRTEEAFFDRDGVLVSSKVVPPKAVVATTDDLGAEVTQELP